MKRLSQRATHLLLLIADRTKRSDDGKLERFWIPSSDIQYVNVNKYNDLGILGSGLAGIYVSGASDASSLRCLEGRRLIERPKTSLPQDYCYCVTEAGLLEIEKYREEACKKSTA